MLTVENMKNIFEVGRPIFIQDPPSPIESCIAEDFQQIIRNMLLKFSEQEQQVIHWRFVNEFTLRKISELLGVSCERVRQIEAKALRKLRQPHRLKKFGYLGSISFCKLCNSKKDNMKCPNNNCKSHTKEPTNEYGTKTMKEIMTLQYWHYLTNYVSLDELNSPIDLSVNIYKNSRPW